MLVKRSMVTAIASVALLGGLSAAAAQGRDAADRGQRLEINELRNDAAQNRLKQQQGSGWLAQPQQDPSSVTTNRKSKRASQPR
jgi:hypothetical protein